MKTMFIEEKELLVEKFLHLPVVDYCEAYNETENGFSVLFQLVDGVQIKMKVIVLKRSFPKQVGQAIKELQELPKEIYGVVVAPYISDTSAQLCIENQVGFFDVVGNCYISVYSIYMHEKGNPNTNIEKPQIKALFSATATTTSSILRELLRDVGKNWKLAHLANAVGCSIGQVSKVKQYLCDQCWAEMGAEGLRITNAKALLDAWSSEYKIDSSRIINCYSLDPISVFEDKLRQIKVKNGIDSYLTAFAGGVRYAPVVRYNKIHVIVRPEDVKEIMLITNCKKVETGANIVIVVASDEMLIDTREVNGYAVASPVQVYLDSMQLKGRGEELAEAVFTKEIEA